MGNILIIDNEQENLNIYKWDVVKRFSDHKFIFFQNTDQMFSVSKMADLYAVIINIDILEKTEIVSICGFLKNINYTSVIVLSENITPNLRSDLLSVKVDLILQLPIKSEDLIMQLSLIIKLSELRNQQLIKPGSKDMDVLLMKEQEKIFESFFNSSLIGIWCFKSAKPLTKNIPEKELINSFFESTCVKCNNTYAKMLGMKKEEIIGLKLSDLMPVNPENIEFLKEFIINEFSITSAISREITVAGEEKYFSNSISAIIKDGVGFEAWGTQNDITDMVKKEDELRSVNANLTAMLENTDDFVMIADKDGYPIMFNTPYANIINKLLGIKMKSGIKPHKLLKDKDTIKWWDKLHERVLKGEKFRVEYNYEYKKKMKHLEVSFNPIKRDDEIIGFSEYTRDITERKHAEKIILENQKNLRQIIDLSPHLIYAKDEDGRFILVNNSVSGIYNTKASELIGKKDSDFACNPEDAKKFRKDDLEVIKTKKAKFIQETITNSKGEIRDLQTTKIPYSPAGLEKKAVLGISVDITDLKRTEKELMLSEERFRSIVDLSQEGIIIIDDNYLIDYANNGLSELIGYENSELIGEDFRKFLNKKSLQLTVERYNKRRQGIPVPPKYEIELVKKDGSALLVEISNVIINDKDDKIKTLTQLLDITQRKRSEKIQHVLYSIASAVNTTPNLDDLFHQIKEYLHEIIDTTNFYVALYDEERDLLSLNYNVDEKDSFTAFPPGKTLSNHVLKTGKPFLATEESIEALEKEGIIELVGSPSRIWLGVPLKIRSKIIGIMVVQSYDNPNLYTEKDMEILEIVSYDIAQAIEHKKSEEELKTSLNEKEVLLKEIHHRVKNNLQIISSLLNMQSREIKDSDTIKLFKESQNRVKSMAIIHHKLYENEDITNVDFNSYVKSLTRNLFHSFKINSQKVKLIVEIDNIMLDISIAIPLGLIMNEIISNSLKYAFPEGRTGSINISLKKNENDFYKLIISDNGIGFQTELGDLNRESLGMNLIEIFVQQLRGSLDIDSSQGVAYIIIFKEDNL